MPVECEKVEHLGSSSNDALQTNRMTSKSPCYGTAIPTATRIKSQGIQTMTVDIRKEVVTAASNLLSNSTVRELRHLRVDGKADQLKLSGRVRSYYHKQLAQETIRCVACGMQMVNHVHVET